MTALQTLISLAGLAAILLVFYEWLRVDYLRQELFEIRDALFDEARAQRISFDSNAYRATRVLLNGLLRFAHRLSLARLLVAVSIVPLGRLRVTEQEFEAALSASREEDRKLCRAYIAKSHNAVAKHMLRSPFAILLLVPLVSFVLTALGISVVATLVRQLASGFKLLDRAAYAEGLA